MSAGCTTACSSRLSDLESETDSFLLGQRGETEFWFTSSFRCYLLKFRFHGQLDLLFESKAVSPVEWSPCCPRTIQPPLTASPCTGRHARLGTRLLAKLCRGRHLRRLSSTRFQGATLIKPDMRISRIRLSDWLHRKAHDGDLLRSRRRHSTPSSPKT